MDDLFEKLKAEPPVDNTKQNEEPELTTTAKIDSTEDLSASPKRKSPIASRSNSIGSNNDDDTKIQINDNKLQDAIDESPKKAKKRTASELGSDDDDNDDEMTETTENSPKKVIPTKASQKLFETSPVELAEEKTETNNVKNLELKTKRFRVRVKRENLVELREKFARERAKQKSKKGNKTPTKKNEKSSPTPTKATAQKSNNNNKRKDISLKKAGSKRKAESSDSPPAKKGKKDTKGSPPGKKNKSTGFFIKLNNNVKKSQQQQQSPKEKVTTRKTNSRSSTSTPVYVTKATKFTRSQLIRTFGKRYFNSRVRIERCRHPMMLTFESNARARKLQAKNKSKNLSVSFKEQVEIIGLSDSESNDSDDVNTTTATKSDATIAAGVTPLHLKKVENGKVVDDIEFDPKLFGDPKAGSNSSTPLRKKKTERKSYSPLKDDSSSTARSELLKMANEKLPPSALLRLSADEEDDEDDECEWIVPIDLPERRLSRTNSITQDGKITTTPEDSSCVNETTTEKPQNNEADKDVPLTEKSQNDEIDKNVSTPEKQQYDAPTEEPQNDKTIESTLSKEDEPTVEKTLSKEDEPTVEMETKPESPTHIENDKQINGNGSAVEQNKIPVEQTQENEPAATIDETSKDECPRLFFDNESNSGTPKPSFTPENQETPDLLVKNALDKLTEDIEKDETEEINKEAAAAAATEVGNNIGEDKSSFISA